jgi:hypothetical protein
MSLTTYDLPPAPTSRCGIVACGALAGELRAVLAAQGLGDRIEIRYLPANLHNRPEGIVPAVEAVLVEWADRKVFVAYADCGTGGGLDELLGRHPGVERLPGAHCYEMFAGADLFSRLHDTEPGTFYLTDFLARHFEALVWQGLGLDRHPELAPLYFGNYRRVVLLGQSGAAAVTAAAVDAAARLGLPLETHLVGRAQLAASVAVELGSRTVPS